ncbi:MAG: signal peptidase I [Acidobacteriota bacterium]|nr:signal peptidase I [Acidobacteriota bacterium]
MEKRNSTLREYFEALLIAVIFLGFTNGFLIKTFYIPSASMEDTLLIGDHLFVNRFIYGSTKWAWEEKILPLRSANRGDVVIFRSPERPSVDMVKRCVAMPGDDVQLRDKDLYINDRWVEDSSYTVHRDNRVVPGGIRQRDNFGPYAVPENGFFCLGDNRDQSYDSRFWGPVPAHFVKGRALLVYWSFGGETPDGTWPGWGAKIRQLGKTAAGFLTRTRWKRTFHLVR